MTNILRKLKLVESNVLYFYITRQEFISGLETIVDNASLNFFSDAFDPFVQTNKKYKGRINSNSFEIKRRKRFFDFNCCYPIAKGSFIKKGDKLRVDFDINGLQTPFMAVFGILMLMYPVVIIVMFSTNTEESSTLLSFVPLIFVHALLMFGIPYMFIRRSVKNFKYDLERELFYLTK